MALKIFLVFRFTIRKTKRNEAKNNFLDISKTHAMFARIEANSCELLRSKGPLKPTRNFSGAGQRNQ
jgi:hypothetical protein